eukprot:jgi/Phyca11/536193/estExt2_fgenesh1_pg.C_PHYCAscaffold_480081
MASALMAFVQGLGTEKQEKDSPIPQEEMQAAPDEIDEADEDMFESDDENTPPKKAQTLLEVAKKEASSSLMEVAKSIELERKEDRPKPSLAALAAELNQEEHERESSKVHTDKVQRTIDEVSLEVKAERVTQRNEQVVTGLKAAVSEQQQQYEEEEFEDDAAIGQGGGTGSSKPKKKVANREALNELAKDKFTRARQTRKPRQEFARLDDNRHCRFTPRLHNSASNKKPSNNDSDEEEGPGGIRGAALRRNEDFMRRMEASERARREQLRRTREEAVYLARVDKKECPNCGNPQSYSELTQKRKKCPNCGVTYKSRIAWSNVAKEFLTRMEEFQQQCKERQREKQEENERREAMACKPVGSEEDTKKTWEEVKDEFLGRLQLDLECRELSRAAIWEEIQRKFSFSPSITPRARQLNLGDFDERLRRNLDERRLRHEQFEARAGAAAAREREFEERNAIGKSKKHFTPSSPFLERMRQDVVKRRERENEYMYR